MRKAFAVIIALCASTFDVRDATLIVGLVLISVGLSMLSVPAALIVPGAILAYVAIFGERINAPAKED